MSEFQVETRARLREFGCDSVGYGYAIGRDVILRAFGTARFVQHSSIGPRIHRPSSIKSSAPFRASRRLDIHVIPLRLASPA